jgi:hypothetical protein
LSLEEVRAVHLHWLIEVLSIGQVNTEADVKRVITQYMQQNEGCDPPSAINGMGLSDESLTRQPQPQPRLQTQDLPQPKALPQPRTDKSKSDGKKLALAASACIGQFQWIPRGKEGFLPLSLAPAEGDDRRGVNQFWQFVQSGYWTDAPPTMSMNCWESVFYCAYKAGLLTIGNLRAILEYAVHEASKKLGDKNRAAIIKSPIRTGSVPHTIQSDVDMAYRDYVEALYVSLGGTRAQTSNRPIANKLIYPQGDLIFINGVDHVCISAGKELRDGVFVPMVYSLWTQNGGRFSRLPLSEILGEEAFKRVSSVPCPF